jgi:hypothetical protein
MSYKKIYPLMVPAAMIFGSDGLKSKHSISRLDYKTIIGSIE